MYLSILAYVMYYIYGSAYLDQVCIVWLYYVRSYTVGALSAGIIPSFAVLHTEKLAFQCATLLNWESGLAMNLAVVCGDFRAIFFYLVC